MIQIKIGIAKNGREYRTFKTDTGNKVRFWAPEGGGARPMTTAGSRAISQRTIGTTARQMYQLGKLAVDLIKARVSQGIGSDDAPMKTLSRGYKKRKQSKGGSGIRDLTFTGDMLDNLNVRSVSESQVRIDITKSKERLKARANEVRAQWFGWSKQDLLKLIQAARGIWGEILGDIGITVAGGGSKPVWMDPWQRNAAGSRDWASMPALRQRIATGPMRLRRAA